MASSGKSADIVVVGGAVIGGSTAHALASGGFDVVVVDPASPPRSSTWAAGGMLSPWTEMGGDDPFLRFALESLDLYESWVEELVGDSGLDVGLRRCGKLVVASGTEGSERLTREAERDRAVGATLELLRDSDLQRIEPGLAPVFDTGLLYHDSAVVDPRALARALTRAGKRCGVRLTEGTVAGLRTSGDRVVGVVLDDGATIDADTVVIAAGAWSARVRGIPFPPPVRPVRGQMIAYRTGLELQRVISGPAYLIPRWGPDEGRLVVGATMEDAGFDRITTPEARQQLHEAATSMIPELADEPVVDCWAGLRPGISDERPVLGPDPDLRGLLWATGHFRNGILLAPATAHLVRALVHDPAHAVPAPLRASRFPRETAVSAG